MKTSQNWFILFILGCIFAGNAHAQTIANIQERLDKIDSTITTMVPGIEPGLSIAITSGDQIVFERHFGFANIPEKELLEASHVLGIASMSKQFTGMAILFLEQEGKLELDDFISEYFPELPLDDRDITITQLLSHTSGLPEITRNESFMDSISQRHTIWEIISLAFEGDFTSEPGMEWRYCNTGYTISAALIEKVSGVGFSEYLNEKIFQPIGMFDTYACDYHTDAENAVQRYFPDSAGFKDATLMHFSNLIGGGGIVSNVHDMAKWGMALISGDGLPDNYKKIWQSNSLNSGEETGYGLGLGINSIKDKTYYYHPGMGDGMNAVNLIFLEDEISITAIRNVSSPKVNSIQVALMAAEYLLF